MLCGCGINFNLGVFRPRGCRCDSAHKLTGQTDAGPPHPHPVLIDLEIEGTVSVPLVDAVGITFLISYVKMIVQAVRSRMYRSWHIVTHCSCLAKHGDDVTEKLLLFMKKISACRLDEIKHIDERLRSFKGGVSWEKYNQCKTANGSAVECLPLLKKSCFGSRFRVFKVIRMSMDIVSSILDSVDTLKVIFLVRDPRATMLSRLEIDYMCPSMERCVPSFCRKLIEDSK
ncbi:hypothetical protein ScPMuIL_010194 [Solemya velum]